jgi:hypothetical protein
VPPIEKFDADSGQHLEEYLRRFETLYENNFRGDRDMWIGQLELQFRSDRDMWIGQLELNLKGEILVASNSMRDMDDSYNNVKRKLCDWYKDMKELRRQKNETNFTKARCTKEEPIHLF